MEEISSGTVVVPPRGANSKTRKRKGEPECGFFTRKKNSGTRTRNDDETKNDYACVQWGQKRETVPNIGYGRRPDKQKTKLCMYFVQR